MSETFGNHMHRHAGQQEVRGMNVAQVVESCRSKGAQKVEVIPTDLMAGADVDKMAEQAKDATMNAADATKDAAEKAVDKVQDAASNAMDSAREAMSPAASPAETPNP